MSAQKVQRGRDRRWEAVGPSAPQQVRARALVVRVTSLNSLQGVLSFSRNKDQDGGQWSAGPAPPSGFSGLLHTCPVPVSLLVTTWLPHLQYHLHFPGRRKGKETEASGGSPSLNVLSQKACPHLCLHLAPPSAERRGDEHIVTAAKVGQWVRELAGPRGPGDPITDELVLSCTRGLHSPNK